jgi:hypothetical protein
VAASQIDFAGDAPADPLLLFRLGHFTYEFMSGRARKTVVTALKFEVRGTDARSQQTDTRKTLGDAGQRLRSNFHASGLEMNGQHCTLNVIALLAIIRSAESAR